MTQKPTEPKIGDRMPDGTRAFNEAKEYAQGLNTQKAHGHDDWHVPTTAEEKAAVKAFFSPPGNKEDVAPVQQKPPPSPKPKP